MSVLTLRRRSDGGAPPADDPPETELTVLAADAVSLDLSNEAVPAAEINPPGLPLENK